MVRLTEEQKEKKKYYRKLIKLGNKEWNGFTHLRKKLRNFTKPTAEKIISIKDDPNYDLYVHSAFEKITDLIEHVDNEWDNEIDGCVSNLEHINLVNEELKDIEQGIKKDWRKEKNSLKIFEDLVEKKCSSQVKEFEDDWNTYVIGKKNKKKYKLGNLLQNRINKKIYEEHTCVVLPDTTVDDIRKSNCDYALGFNAFFNAWEKSIKTQKTQSKKNIWMKKYISSQTAKKYYDLLTSTINTKQVKDRIEQNYEDYIVNWVKEYKEFDEKEKPDWRKNKVEYDRWRKIKNQYHGAWNYIDYKTKKIDKEKIKKEAKQHSEDRIHVFIFKNMEKLANVLKNRDDCDDMTSNLGVTSDVIEGKINVSCKNGDSFQVRNQLVYVNPYNKKPHYRFPTTFHRIKYKKKDFASESEQWMNEVFSQK